MKVTELLNIAGKTAIVTGGAGLYGKDIATGLLEAGCRVILASRNLAALEETKEQFGKQGYPDVTCYGFDQGEVASIDDFVERVYTDYGDIDILVNNAVARPMKNFNADIKSWETSMKVNATGFFYLTRAIGNRMAERGEGSIINIASIQGVVGVDLTLYEGTEMDGAIPDYFFHKGGVINLTRFLASYYGKYGVRVNSVAPGGKFADQNLIFLERYNARTFLGRMADDDDIKGVIVLLASQAAKYITGENIMLDAGYVQK
ncbi:MAG: SDR family oxidoreductase [Candidatus Latescibacterota bacterium]